MLLLFPVLPATVQAPSLPRSLEGFLEALDPIPQAFIDGRDERITPLLCKARKHWDVLRAQGVGNLPARDLDLVSQRLADMGALKPRLQAEAALEIASLLAGRYAQGRTHLIRSAERVVMTAWCRVEAGRWDALPDLGKAFGPLLEADHHGRHRALRQVHGTLEDLKEAVAARSVMAAKRSLEALLDDLSGLERS